MGLIPFGIVIAAVGVLIAIFGPRNSATTIKGSGNGRGVRIVHSVVGGIIVAMLGTGLTISGIVVAAQGG